MKTRQYKGLGKIGPVIIGAGFPIQEENKRNNYPKDRLEQFLNTNPNNSEAVMAFSEKYLWIPTGTLNNMSQDWKRIFKEEQEQIKKILEDFSKGGLSTTELELLNSKAKDSIKTKLSLITENEALQFNSKGPNDEIMFTPEAKKHIIEIKTHSSSSASLWEEVLRIIMDGETLKNCIGCGDFFKINKKSHRKKYCTPECSDKHRKRMRYKRLKQNSPG